MGVGDGEWLDERATHAFGDIFVGLAQDGMVDRTSRAPRKKMTTRACKLYKHPSKAS